MSAFPAAVWFDEVWKSSGEERAAVALRGTGKVLAPGNARSGSSGHHQAAKKFAAVQ
jgi:hypothetical protein